MIIKPNFIGLKSFLLFSLLVLFINLLVCFSWHRVLLWHIVGMQFFLAALYFLVLWATKSLFHHFPDSKIGILLGGVILKMFVALGYILMIILKHEEHEVTIVLAFVVNYYWYLFFSVRRIISWNQD